MDVKCLEKSNRTTCNNNVRKPKSVESCLHKRKKNENNINAVAIMVLNTV